MDSLSACPWAAYVLSRLFLVRSFSHSLAKPRRKVLSYSVLTLESTSHNFLQLYPTAGNVDHLDLVLGLISSCPNTLANLPLNHASHALGLRAHPVSEPSGVML